MATYILTGGTTGIGAAIKAQLLSEHHTVVTLDIRDGDYNVDLGDPQARQQVISQVKADHPSVDGIITCAGVASHFPDPGKILSINYWGTVALIEGLVDTVKEGGRIVAISSNSAPQCQRPALIEAMLAGDEAQATALAADASGHDCYSGSKQAVARWMRKQAPEFARQGIMFNAVAPGYIETPMTQQVAQSDTYGDAIRQFVASIPVGRPGLPEDVANLVLFLLSPAASFIAGSLIFIDGAHDAMLRPDGSF